MVRGSSWHVFQVTEKCQWCHWSWFYAGETHTAVGWLRCSESCFPYLRCSESCFPYLRDESSALNTRCWRWLPLDRKSPEQSPKSASCHVTFLNCVKIQEQNARMNCADQPKSFGAQCQTRCRRSWCGESLYTLVRKRHISLPVSSILFSETQLQK